jgi:biopolymer transport protein ExbD
MNPDLIKIIGIMFVVLILIYLALKLIKQQPKFKEGLTNSDGTETALVGNTNALSQNIASGAETFTNEINKKFTSLKDSFHLESYRVNYENVIIQLDDYVNALMLQKILSLDRAQLTEDNVLNIMAKINILKDGKVSLNTIMKFVDAT